MSKTVIALYDDFPTASNAVEALVDAGFDRDDISLVANDANEKYAKSVTSTTDVHDDDDVKPGQGAGFGAVVGGLVGLGVALIPGIGPVIAAGPLAAALMAGIGAATGAVTGGVVAGLVDLGIPEEEAQHFAEGIRRGGALVSVDLDSEEHVTRAEEILNRYNPVNIDERGEIYRQSGWTGFDASAQPYSQQQTSSASAESDTRKMQSGIATGTQTINAGEQQKLDVVEEELQVGKREVEGKTVRVHTRVTERPVQEQVTLRDEQVTVERRPVDRPAQPGDLNAFQEGTIELTEKHEEPIVNKTARVVEEVVVGKQANQRTETVQDTVRRKDVEVEGTGTGTTSASSLMRSYADYEPRFRSAYTTRYASSGGTWEDYDPAYRYGYNLANSANYQDSTWDQVEAEARQRWESNNPNTWDRFKGAIRDAWDEIQGRS